VDLDFRSGWRRETPRTIGCSRKFQALSDTRGHSVPYINRHLEDLRRKVVRLIADVE